MPAHVRLATKNAPKCLADLPLDFYLEKSWHDVKLTVTNFRGVPFKTTSSLKPVSAIFYRIFIFNQIKNYEKCLFHLKSFFRCRDI